MSTRPTSWPAWASTANYPAGTDPWSATPTVVAPSGGQQAAGFAPNTKPPAQWTNWFWNKVGSGLDWLRHLPTITDDTPQSVFTDASGNNRYLVDHNGYPMGRNTVFEEPWVAQTWAAITTTTEPIPSTRMGVWISGTVALAPVTASSTYPAPAASIAIASGTAKGTYYSLAPVFHSGATLISAVVEWEAAITNTTGAASELFFGVSSQKDAQIADTYARFHWLQGANSGKWYCETRNTGAQTQTDGGVVPATSSFAPSQRFKLEIHGSASPYGACARFFIDNVLRQTVTTNLPNNAMYLTFGVYSANGGVAQGFVMGPPRCVANRFLAGSTL